MFEHPQLAGANTEERPITLNRAESPQGGAFGPHCFADLDTSHCRWLGPSWFSLQLNGTVEIGALLLANPRRTTSRFKIKTSRNFMLYWVLLDADGNQTWHGQMKLIKLSYNTAASTVAKRKAGNLQGAAALERSVKCVLTRRITEAIDPSGYEAGVSDIPWIPPAPGALLNIGRGDF